MNNNEQPSVFDEAAFSTFVNVIWAGHNPDTRIFVGAVPSNKNKARAEELEKSGQRLPTECRTHYRAFGPEDTESLLKFLRAENGRRNLSLKMGRFDKDASSANLSNVSYLHFAWLDVEARTDAEKQLACDAFYGEGVPSPHVVVNSGGGIHAYWLYTQPLQRPDMNMGRTINEHFARVFAGDTSVTHAAGALRVPGSINVNRDKPCTVLFVDTDTPRHDPARLLRWLDAQGPHLTMTQHGIKPVPPESREALRAHEKEAEHARTHGKDWDNVVASLSIEGAANAYGGRNRALAMFAGKVYAMGGSVESAIAMAIEKGCTLSEQEIKSVCESVARTHERMNETEVPKTREEAKARKAEAAAAELPEEQQDARPGPSGEVAGSSPAGEATAPAPEDDDPDVDPTRAIARLKNLIARGNDEDDDYKFTVTGTLREIKAAFDEWIDGMGSALLHEGESGDKGWWWCYNPNYGIWEERTRQQIEMAVQRFWHAVSNAIPKSSDMQEIVAVIEREAHRPVGTVPWDEGLPGHHLIVSADGQIIDILTGDVLEPDMSMYLTTRRRVAADYDPKAGAPVWDAAVRMMFDDSPEKDKIADMLEEWMGSALLGPDRPRDTYKALLLTGESLGGKSSLGHALRSVMGEEHVSAAGMDTVAGPFGLSTFFEKRASVWICDDPDATTKLPDGIVKKLITNESVNINVKRKSLRDARLGLTVGIFCNEMPRIDDTSDAVYNRMLMLRSGIIFTTQPDKSDPRHRLADPILADKFAAERSGILNRMIAGARRLMAKGTYTMPAAVTTTREEVHDLQAPARAFIKACVQPMPDDKHCVRRVHLRQAFVGFMESENPGWYRGIRNAQWEMRRFYKALHSIFPASGEKRSGKIRGTPAEQTVQTRLNLTPEGIAYLGVGKSVEEGKPDQNFENDPVVKHANDLRYLGLDQKGKPLLETVEGGKAEAR